MQLGRAATTWMLTMAVTSPACTCNGHPDSQPDTTDTNTPAEDTAPPPEPQEAPVGFHDLDDVVDVRFSLPSIASPGDFSGDGVTDLAVWGGGVFVYTSPLPSSIAQGEDDAWTASLLYPGSHWYPWTFTSGDHNADGFSDLAISAIDASGPSERCLTLVYDGPIEGDRVMGEDTADAVMLGVEVAHAGVSLSMGDSDGDGTDDILIGAPDENGPDQLPGSAYLVRGPLQGEASLDEATTVFEGDLDRGGTGGGVSLAADLDGDGLNDSIIVAPGGTGALYVINGPPPTGTVSVGDADTIMNGSPAASMNRMSTGDMDGDGHDDFVLSDSCGYGACGGAVWIFTGPLPATLGMDDAVAWVYDGSGGAYLGTGLSMDHDLDADGNADLAAGAPEETSSDWVGGVYVFYGPMSGSYWVTDADATIKGRRVDGEPDMGPGGYLASAGDSNDDGFDDLFFTGKSADIDSGSFIVFGGMR